MFPLKGERSYPTLHSPYQRPSGGHCDSDQNHQMEPAAVIIEEVLEMPTLHLSPLLSYKLEIKIYFKTRQCYMEDRSAPQCIVTPCTPLI